MNAEIEQVQESFELSKNASAFMVILLCDPNKFLSDEEIRFCVDFREEARAEKDWKTSDSVRQFLLDHSVEVKDAPKGPMAFRK